MPDAVTGGETIAERITRLRADLVRVRATIARSEDAGQQPSIGGVAVTEIAYERALKREASILQQLAELESRIGGGYNQTAIAQLQTVMHS